jgi:sulfate/thiosulfate-binding protein
VAPRTRSAADAGKGVTFSQSYGASGDQSRKVESGLPADVVNFSLEPDITRLVKSGQVADDWNANQYKGVPFGSVVTIIVRKGNPKGIHDWDDLLKPGIQVVTPNPFSSGSAKWNLLAPYAFKSNGGADPAAGLAYLTKLIDQHVKVQPKSGREATETFNQGTGDALLTYENEAIFDERNGDPVEHVTPPATFKIENPIAVVQTSKHLAQAKAFVDFQYTKAGQTAWAQAGFRPVDPTVAQEFAKDFPAPRKLYTIQDLGGWSKVNDSLFDPDNGSVAKIYNQATQ